MIRYVLLQPILRILTKSPKAAVQTVLHALFLPTPFKVMLNATAASSTRNEEQNQDDPQENPSTDINTTPTTRDPNTKRPILEEVLRPGALYANCGVVNLDVKLDPALLVDLKDKDKDKDKDIGAGSASGLEDDGEYGGEVAGRAVWELFEEKAKEWEHESPVWVPQGGDGGDGKGKAKSMKATVEDEDEAEEKEKQKQKDYYA